MFYLAVFLLLLVLVSLVFYVPIRNGFKVRAGVDGEGRTLYEVSGAHAGVNIARGAAVVIALVLGVFGSIVQVDSQQVVVLQEFGNDAGTRGEGLSFVPPWYDTYTFDTRIVTIEYTAANNNPITGRAGDDATYSADVAIRLRVPDAASAQLVFNEYRDTEGFIQNAARNDARDTMRTQFERFPVLELDSQRTLLSGDACTALEEGWSDVGVTCEEVDIRAIRIDADVEAAAEAVNTARLRADAAAEDVRRAADLAQIEVIEAQAAFDAQQIFECGYDEEVIDGETVIIPKNRDDGDCDDILSDRGLYVRCLAGRTGSTEGAQQNQFIVPPDCESILTGETASSPLGGAEVLIQP